MWWPFGKKEEKLDEIKKNLEVSFSNVKKDHESLKQEHHSKISDILQRLEKIESHLFSSKKETEEYLPELKKSGITQMHFDNLTEKQKEFCRILAALHSESPNRWVSFKFLAEELYPNYDYNKVRSTISEYTSLLEELGFVKKRIKGNKGYVMTTQINPYIKETPEIKVQKIKKVKEDKKSKQS